MTVATKTYIRKTIERLHGIITGISINCHINDQEVIALKTWMESHELMHNLQPFKDLNILLTDILEDGVIDEQEREDLLEWCSDVINERGVLENYTQVIRQLHGIFSGIICDNVIKPNELDGLRDWLLDYEDLHDWWPINELLKLVEDILADGKVDENEHKVLETFFADFSEQLFDNAVIHDEAYWNSKYVASPCPIFKSISSICEQNPDIVFDEKLFCLTGPAASGRRQDIFKEIEKLGGRTHKSAVKNLDYLVIGAQSSPAWVYSTYGRKIETVLNRQEKDPNCKTIIINEYDFINAAKSVGGFANRP